MTRVAKFSFVVETRYSYDGINGTGYRGTVTLHVCSAGLPRPPQPVLGLLDRADGMVRAHAARRGAQRPLQHATTIQQFQQIFLRGAPPRTPPGRCPGPTAGHAAESPPGTANVGTFVVC